METIVIKCTNNERTKEAEVLERNDKEISNRGRSRSKSLGEDKDGDGTENP